MSFGFGDVIDSVNAVAPMVMNWFGNQEAAKQRSASDDKAFERAMYLWQQNLQAQREFAQSGITWKVKDAKNVGLSPLAAVGASGTAFSPTAQVFSGGDDGDARKWSDLGQDLSRAITTTWDRRKRRITEEVTLDRLKLQRDNDALQNELIRTQINQMKGNASPGFSTSGNINYDEMPPEERWYWKNEMKGLDGQSPSVTIERPPTRVQSMGSDPSIEKGILNEVAWKLGNDGLLRPIQSTDHMMRTQNDFPAMLGWHIRNSIIPWFKGIKSPSPKEVAGPLEVKDPEHYRTSGWKWDWKRQGFRALYFYDSKGRFKRRR